MTGPEDERSQDHQSSQNRSLTIRSEQISLESVSSPFLKMAGFSEQLPAKLLRLNSLLWSPPVEKIGIYMTPGRVPIVYTNIEHGNKGYRVSIESTPGEQNTAELGVYCPDARSGFNFWVKLEDIKKFKDTLLPDAKAKLYANASRHLLEKLDDFSKDFDEVTEDDLWWLNKKRATVPEYGTSTLSPFGEVELQIVGHNKPLVVFNLTVVHYMPETILISLTSLNYKDEASKVEASLDTVAELFSHPLWPPKSIGE